MLSNIWTWLKSWFVFNPCYERDEEFALQQMTYEQFIQSLKGQEFVELSWRSPFENSVHPVIITGKKHTVQFGPNIEDSEIILLPYGKVLGWEEVDHWRWITPRTRAWYENKST